MNKPDNQTLLDAYFYGCILHQERTKLIQEGGYLPVVDELVNLASELGISIGEAANRLLEQNKATIAQRRADLRQALSVYDGCIESHSSDIRNLRHVIEQNTNKVKFLTGQVKSHPKAQQEKRDLLKQQGFSAEQIENIISLGAGEVKQMNEDIVQAQLLANEANAQLQGIFDRANELKHSCSFKRGHSEQEAA